jgi:hypothetical protein
MGSGIPASGIPASGIPAYGNSGTAYPRFSKYSKQDQKGRDEAAAAAFAKLVEKLDSDQDGVAVAAATQILNRQEGLAVQTVQGKDGAPLVIFRWAGDEE